MLKLPYLDALQTAAGVVFTCWMTADKGLTLVMTGLVFRADCMIASTHVAATKAEALSLSACQIATVSFYPRLPHPTLLNCTTP